MSTTSTILVADQTPPPAAPALIFEERLKQQEHPLDSYYKIVANAETNSPPERDDMFRFKWNGLFYLTPVEKAYMARLRIPGGQLQSRQLREIAAIAKELTTGYIQITTRANLQVRLIEPKDTPEVLRRIQSIGLHTRGAGADNVRNITCNPTAGVDPHELIDCTPYVEELAHYILNHREFYDLPRKFNVAFDGGGLIGSVEDTNDIGIRAVSVSGDVAFRITIGGATGHKAFGRDLGVLVTTGEVVDVVLALIRVYIAHGNRGSRKAARLKYLLETWSLDQYLAAAEELLGKQLYRSPVAALTPVDLPASIPHSHIGAFPQKQAGLYYIGVAVPVGQLTPAQLEHIADIADQYASGKIRLTVWQNLILPDIPESDLETVKEEILRMGFNWKQSNLSSGVIACTGNTYCKFSVTNTKSHALALIDYLEPRVQLDVPVNIHFTGCPHSCAQHYIGDIGLLGVRGKDRCEAYHVFVGGGFGKSQAVARQIFQAVPFDELDPLIEQILLAFQSERRPNETFQAFTARHELTELQALFAAQPVCSLIAD